MALAFDATASGVTGAGDADTAWSWTHTCTGANLYLFVGVSYRAATTEVVSGVTYNGVALTFLGQAHNGTTSSELWGLVAPATGAHTITVTMSASVQCGIGGSVSYTGADQTGSASTSTIRGGAATTATGTSTTPTVTVTSAAGEIVQDALCVTGTVPSPTVDASQTQDWNTTDLGTNFRRGAGSHEAGASSVVMSWTITSGAWATCAASLIPAGGGGGSYVMFDTDNKHGNLATMNGGFQ